MMGKWAWIGLAFALVACGKSDVPVSPVHATTAAVVAPALAQANPSEPLKAHLKGAFPDPYVYVPHRSNLRLNFPVVKEFSVDGGTYFEGDNDKVGTPYFVGYDGLTVKLIRGLTASEVQESIDHEIARATSRGVTKNGARYGFSVRKGKKGEASWSSEDPPKGFAELDLIQKDISGNGFLYIAIEYRGDVDPTTLKNWLVEVVNGYSVEMKK